MKIPIPFGRTFQDLDVPGTRLKGILESRLHTLEKSLGERELVENALARPIASPPLSELAAGKKRVAIITSDHPRPVPSRVTLPLLLHEIRSTSPDADITVVVATGCHRAMTDDEMRDRFGGDVCERERFLVHDATADDCFEKIGVLPSGGDCIVNKAVLDADLLVAEGFIEPHFFAGFSGGRKAVMPGCANRITVLANHCAEFIANDRSRTGILDGNPIHADMVHAARRASLAFILNVILDADKRIVAAFAGDMDDAHRAGCDFLRRHCEVDAAPADIVVTSNGGYPLDQNIYQAVKGMTGAEASCRPGGVIVIAAECSDGHGGDDFHNAFSVHPTPEAVMREIMSRGRNETEPDQWQTQIFCRVLMKCRVVMVTGPNAPRGMVERLNMEWAPTVADAMRRAGEILGDPGASVTVIPDGVGVIVRE
ncbi:MAG: nickel-dependent lactate racemase [Planctomycetota bacterium]|jgi:nickel-dependent lactate racemase|nr:nickel-dependent lactate racemase [Planctomycetota bacterium]